jgi:hypothetical protein
MYKYYLRCRKEVKYTNEDISTAISVKLNCVLLKNKGWKQLKNINNILVAFNQIN